MSVKWSEEGVPISTQFDDVYYSKDNGLEESRYIFLQGNDLPARWKKKDIHTIGELGFGTGLNFLATWKLWQKHKGTCKQLIYITHEKFPLSREELTKAHTPWPELSSSSQQLINRYPQQPNTINIIDFFKEQITLILCIGEVSDTLRAYDQLSQKFIEHFQNHTKSEVSNSEVSNPQRLRSNDNSGNTLRGYDPVEAHVSTLPSEAMINPLVVDTWFLDGFAPSKNAEMWSQEVFQTMAKYSALDAHYATFSAARMVRDNLGAAGFTTERIPGYGKKRNMLRGRLVE